MNHHNIPIYPGAMTPAQYARRIIEQATAVSFTAGVIATFTAIIMLFN